MVLLAPFCFQKLNMTNLPFVILLFASALFIEGLGSLISVLGVGSFFGANLIIMLVMVSIDIGKIVAISFTYQFWRSMPSLMKIYALLAIAVTMLVTSAGAAGYLSGEFQKTMSNTQQGAATVSILKEQQQKYQDRKTQIDNQIAGLPAKTSVTQRLRLMNGFKAEQKRLDEQILSIDKKLPELQIAQISTEAKAGPIMYVSKAFNMPVEQALKYVILLLVFVFDPFAVFLTIAGNIALYKYSNRNREILIKAGEEKEEETKEEEAINFMPLPKTDFYKNIPTYTSTTSIHSPVEELEVPDKEPEVEVAIMPEEVAEPEVEVLPEINKEPVKSSSLHLITEDPNTVVYAGNEPHFRDSTFRAELVSANPGIEKHIK